MRHTFNFSAGPAVLPESVLQEASDEMLSYKNSDMSVMEISHRSALFQSIIDETEHDLRILMNIPDDYEVLFLQGGTSLQFSMIPMNFMKNRKASYILTGYWSKKAYEEAQQYGQIDIMASSEDKNFSYIPDCRDLNISNDTDYVYMCENNTIYGTKFKHCPNSKGKILINDISSCFLSEPVKVSDYGMLFGG
ncbi:MAG: 3-phosphoserine/phosphohydroxythreonine transaminase, partial [Clostridiales bacterium]|nr:3-phosphoserine/phosphohydroxythreonine transaminase [Clostridiales bacterium]